MRFLIAGSSGFLGTRLRERLRRDGPRRHPARTPRRPAASEVRWDPYAAPLGVEVVDAPRRRGQPGRLAARRQPALEAVGRELMNSRVTTTRSWPRRSPPASSKPVVPRRQRHQLLRRPRRRAAHRADADSRGDALLTRVTRAWQAADVAGVGGRRPGRACCAPPPSSTGAVSRWGPAAAVQAGLGRPARRRQPVHADDLARDWVDAVVHPADDDVVSGPVNLCCRARPDQRGVHRGAGPPAAPAGRRCTCRRVVLRTAAGELARSCSTRSTPVPEALLGSGYTFRDPDVARCCARASPQPLTGTATAATRQLPPRRDEARRRGRPGALLGSGARRPRRRPPRPRPPGRRRAADSRPARAGAPRRRTPASEHGVRRARGPA